MDRPRKTLPRFLLGATVGLGLTVATGLLLLGDRQPSGPATATAATPPAVTVESPAVPSPPEPPRASPQERPAGAQVKMPVARRRLPPPRLKSQPPPRAGPAPVTFEALMQAHSPLGRGFSQLADQTRLGDRPMVQSCVRQLVARAPEQVRDQQISGAITIRLQVKDGLARATDIQPLREGDTEFARCMAEGKSFMQREFDVSGTPDMTVELEWPYRYGWR